MSMSGEAGQKMERRLSQVSFDSTDGASRDSDENGKPNSDAELGKTLLAGKDKRIAWLETRTRNAMGMASVDAVKR
jgi:hypothetical protein